MVVEKNKVISVSYELRTSKEGGIVEKTNENKPLTFLFGHGNMLAKFEENLSGLNKGDSFDFMLKSEDAYGKRSPNAIMDIQIDVFKGLDKENLVIGRELMMQDKDGHQFRGKILEISEKTVKMDFNHPMADKNLYFTGQVVTIREATEQEINQGHIDHECTNCGKH